MRNMQDEEKSRAQLLFEVERLRRRIARLESGEAQGGTTKEALRESERKLQQLTDALPTIISYVDADQYYRFNNLAYEEWFGLSRNDLLGKPLREVLGDAAYEEVRAYVEAALSGKTVTHERTVDFKDGSRRYIQAVYVPHSGLEGGIKGFFALGVDLTERKWAEEALREAQRELENRVEERTEELVRTNERLRQEILDRRRAEQALLESEEKYRQLFEMESDAIFLIDSRQGRILEVNASGIALYGYSRKELRKMRYGDLLAEDHVAREIQLEQISMSRVYHRKKDGVRFPVEVAARSFTWCGIEVSVAAVRDISERLKAEEERLTAGRFEAMGILAGGIAHDLNNILTAILGNIDLAKMLSKPGEMVFRKLEKAEKAALRARSLSERFLTYAKGGEPMKKPTSIPLIVEDTAGIALSRAGLELDFRLPGDLWAVEADEGQIHQVFSNIFINAAQAMPEGGLVRIEAQNILQDKTSEMILKRGKYVRITIADQGPGIRKEDLPRIFDPYFTTKPMGTGLGLATVYSIIRRHEGSISVQSVIGTGTTFEILLPASDQPAPKKALQPRKANRGKGSVLVVDDERIIREVVGEILSYLGYEVSFATDGAQAIDLYCRAAESGTPFDVILMDLNLPSGINGKEAVSRLHSIDPHVKVIAAAGYASDPILMDFKKHGFLGAVSKPYRIEQLSRELLKVIIGGDAEESPPE